jgi:hypothetical protein
MNKNLVELANILKSIADVGLGLMFAIIIIGGPMLFVLALIISIFYL